MSLFEPRVGRNDHRLWPWERSEEKGERYAPTICDAGSDDSVLSSTSIGLRRKPIPMGSLSVFSSL